MSKKKSSKKSKLIGLITIPLALGIGAFFYQPNQGIKETKVQITQAKDWFDVPFTDDEIRKLLGADIIGVVGGYELERTQRKVDEYLIENKLRFTANPFNEGELLDSRSRRDRIVRYVKLTDSVPEELLANAYEVTKHGLNFWKHPRLPHPGELEIRLSSREKSMLGNNLGVNLRNNRRVVIHAVKEFGSCGLIKHRNIIKINGKIETIDGFNAVCDKKYGAHFFFGDRDTGVAYILWAINVADKYRLYGNPAIEVLHAQLKAVMDHRDDEEYFVHGLEEVWLSDLERSDLARSLELQDKYNPYDGWGEEERTHEYARKIKAYGIKEAIDKYLDGRF